MKLNQSPWASVRPVPGVCNHIFNCFSLVIFACYSNRFRPSYFIVNHIALIYEIPYLLNCKKVSFSASDYITGTFAMLPCIET